MISDQTTLPLKVPGPNHPSLGLVPPLKKFQTVLNRPSLGLVPSLKKSQTVPSLCVDKSFQLGWKIQNDPCIDI